MGLGEFNTLNPESNQRKQELKDRLKFKRAPMFDFDELHDEKQNPFAKPFMANKKMACMDCSKGKCTNKCAYSVKSNFSSTDGEGSSMSAYACPIQDKRKTKDERYDHWVAENKNKKELGRLYMKHCEYNENMMDWKIDRFQKSLVASGAEPETATYKDDFDRNRMKGTSNLNIKRGRAQADDFGVIISGLDLRIKNKEKLTQAKTNLIALPSILNAAIVDMKETGHKFKTFSTHKKVAFRTIDRHGERLVDAEQRKFDLKNLEATKQRGFHLDPITKKAKQEAVLTFSKGKAPQKKKTLGTRAAAVKFDGGTMAGEAIEKTSWKSDDRNPSQLDNEPILLKINVDDRPQKQTFDITVNTRRHRRNTLNTVIIDQYDFCRQCQAYPCMKLLECIPFAERKRVSSPANAPTLENRIKLYSYILGSKRVGQIDSMIKRVKRNSELAKSCIMNVVTCKGNGGCPACSPYSVFSRKWRDFQENTLDQDRKRTEIQQLQLEKTLAVEYDFPHHVFTSITQLEYQNQRSQLSMRGAANLIKSATMMQRLYTDKKQKERNKLHQDMMERSKQLDTIPKPKERPVIPLVKSASSGSHANVVRFNENEVTTLHPNSLKWKRVEELCQGELKSPYEETRKDAAKQLGLLECGDPVVFYALKTAIVEDQNERVQYEAMKSLTHLGCLEAEILQMLLDYLIVGNEEVRIDMLKTLCDAKNVMFMDKANNVYPELLKVLGQFCKETNPHDEVSFQAAITFGRICTKNEGAVAKMYSYLEHGTDTHKKYAALTYLVRQFNETSWELATRVLEQLVNSPVWEYRRDSAQLLQHLGRRNLCQTEETEEIVYNVLDERLWDDSTEIVRLECAKTLVTLDLYPRAADDVIKRLSDPVSTVRAHAVISLATLGIKQTKVMRFLAEMLELDQSNAVRKEIIKAFATLGVTDRNILKILRDKERGEGVLAVEARKAIKQIEMIAAL